MNLTPTRMEHVYEVGDDSGYGFTVVATYDAETGWSAAVQMASHGYKTPEAAVQYLRHSAEAFLRQLQEPKP